MRPGKVASRSAKASAPTTTRMRADEPAVRSLTSAGRWTAGTGTKSSLQLLFSGMEAKIRLVAAATRFVPARAAAGGRVGPVLSPEPTSPKKKNAPSATTATESVSKGAATHGHDLSTCSGIGVWASLSNGSI